MKLFLLRQPSIKSTLLFFLLICVFSSCGHKCPCSDATLPLYFVSYPDIETDTFIIRRFVKGTNFSSLIDTLKVFKGSNYYDKQNDTLEVNPIFNNSIGLSGKEDYRIYFPYSTTSINLKLNLVIQEGLCGRCSNSVPSYIINGQQFKVNPITYDTGIYIHEGLGIIINY